MRWTYALRDRIAITVTCHNVLDERVVRLHLPALRHNVLDLRGKLQHNYHNYTNTSCDEPTRFAKENNHRCYVTARDSAPSAYVLRDRI